MSDRIKSLAFIGFGEAGRILCRDLLTIGLNDIRAYDIAFSDAKSAQLRDARSAGITIAASTQDVVAGAEVAISAVTAGADLDVARELARTIDRDTFVIDINSVAPGTKAVAAELIDAAGGRYVEAAVMAPIPPKGLRTPILLGGKHAAAFLARTSTWKLDARPFSDRIGAASSVKMCRSIMVKGVEALALECALSAHRYGVVDEVLGSLSNIFPGQEWQQRVRYLISRALVHGKRRAEEMREVAKTIEDAGLEPTMTRSTVAVQEWADGLGRALGPESADGPDLAHMLRELDEFLRGARDAAQ